MSIQLFVPNFRVEECLAEIRECLEKGWTGLGYKTVEFEEKWKQYTSLPNAHFLSSNTVGLHLALEIFKSKLGWSSDDEVITTPLTFVSSNHAILYSNLIPVFADVDDSLCLCPNDVKNKITDKTRAVMFVGIGGNVGQYAEIKKICDEKGIILILDAAHMAGTRVDGKHVGHDADCTIFSFQAVKNLATADSGMICFKDAEYDTLARKLSWLGINKDTYARTASQGAYKWKYEVEDLGYKYHGNSVMAAIALVSLKYLDRDNSYRRQIASWYSEELKSVENIKIIEHNSICESSRHLFQVRVKNRDDVMAQLNAEDIYPGVHYRDNTEYKLYREFDNNCTNARNLSNEIISLPIHMGITYSDVKKITKLLSLILNN